MPSLSLHWATSGLPDPLINDCLFLCPSPRPTGEPHLVELQLQPGQGRLTGHWILLCNKTAAHADEKNLWHVFPRGQEPAAARQDALSRPSRQARLPYPAHPPYPRPEFPRPEYPHLSLLSAPHPLARFAAAPYPMLLLPVAPANEQHPHPTGPRCTHAHCTWVKVSARNCKRKMCHSHCLSAGGCRLHFTTEAEWSAQAPPPLDNTRSAEEDYDFNALFPLPPSSPPEHNLACFPCLVVRPLSSIVPLWDRCMR
ncbi:hypothetical protein C8F01DRAFT_1083551 [Mycena amicta]|nr:hypothetical protein C8F01DRAFT_1083551 [Mycena amicta]